MSARDQVHDKVRNALAREGWTITHDPLKLKWNRTKLLIDLGAERVIVAEKASRRIAVEIKSFIGASPVDDLKDALGQYRLYRHVLKKLDPQRELWLAIGKEVWKRLFATADGEDLRTAENLSLIVFDSEQEEIVQWIP